MTRAALLRALLCRGTVPLVVAVVAGMGACSMDWVAGLAVGLVAGMGACLVVSVVVGMVVGVVGIYGDVCGIVLSCLGV